MTLKSRLFLAALAALSFRPLARADSPCGPTSFLFDPRRTSADFAAMADWIAVGVVVKRVEKKTPYPNCNLDDRSKCAQWDRSELTVKVERYEKGRGPPELVLVAEWCAPDPPGTAGGRYRFYGRGEARSSYAMYEAAPAEQKRPAPAR